MHLKGNFRTEMDRIAGSSFASGTYTGVYSVHINPSFNIRVTIVTRENFRVFFLIGRLMSDYGSDDYLKYYSVDDLIVLLK